jgi:hypothetical protein
MALESSSGRLIGLFCISGIAHDLHKIFDATNVC